MSNLEVVRAWKDPEFRATLGRGLPEHPAGQIELIDPGLMSAVQLGPKGHTFLDYCKFTKKPCIP